MKKSKEFISEKLIDEKNGLVWEKYDSKNWTKFGTQESVIDEWSNDEGVRRFVSKRRSISQHLTSLVTNKKNMFYAYSGDRVVGVVLIVRPEKDYEYATIDYIVVDPKLQGQGVGARMICSIKDHGEFFAQGYKGKLDAFVDNHNFASKGALKKSGFVAAKPIVSHGIDGYCRWYFEERSMTNDK